MLNILFVRVRLETQVSLSKFLALVPDFTRCTYGGGVGGVVLEQHLGLLEETFGRLHHIVS